MKTIFDNKDVSSTGITLTLHCFRDTVVAREDWECDFETLQHEDYRHAGVHFYTCGGSVEKPDTLSDCYDLSACTEKTFRAFCRELSTGAFRELVEEKMQYDSWKSLAIEWMDDEDCLGIYTAAKNGFPEIEGARLLVDCVSVQGYSQGDHALVLYRTDQGHGEQSALRDCFINLFYDAPIYCRLEIETEDGTEELFLEEGLADAYKWEPEQILDSARKQLEDFPEDCREYALNWLEENIPEHPEYI